MTPRCCRAGVEPEPGPFLDRAHCAVVTGDAVEIGQACVERLVEKGGTVAICDVMDEEGDATMKDVIRFGILDIMRNNAGTSGSVKPTDQVLEAVTYAPERIRINYSHPGAIWTPEVKYRLRTTSPDMEAAKVAAGAAIWESCATPRGPWSGWSRTKRSSSPGPTLPSIGDIRRDDATD